MKMNRICRTGAFALVFCLLFAAFMLFGPMTHAQDTPVYQGVCGAQGDNLRWSYDPETKAFTITGSGAMCDFETSAERPWDSYRDEILSVSLPDGMTTIGDVAFQRFTSVTEVEIPDTVTSIGKQAFCGLGVREYHIPDSVETIVQEAFFKSSALEKIELPDSVTSLGTGVFADCSSLSEVRLPSGLTEIPDWSFADTALTGIEIPASVKRIGSAAFQDCASLLAVDFPDGLESIGKYAFFGCRSLTQIVLPDSVTQIGESAFASCCGLTDLTLSKGMTEVSFAAFEYCGLTELTIPDNIKRIDDWAFNQCTDLRELHLSEGLGSLGIGAFYGIGAETLMIPVSLTDIGPASFAACFALHEIGVAEGNPNYINVDGILFSMDGKTLIQYPAGKTETSFIVPDGVEILANNAFDTTVLEEIIFPESLVEIGEDCFQNCQKLLSVSIPAGVTEFGDRAFGFIFDDKTGDLTPIEGLTLRGFEGSAAEAFAEENGIAFSTRIFSGTCGAQGGNLIWRYDPETKTLTITGSGDMYDFPASSGRPWHSCRDEILSVSLPDGLTSIGGLAFQRFTSVEEIVIPDTVTYIGWQALAGTTALRELRIPDSVKELGEGVLLKSGIQKLYVGKNVTYLPIQFCDTAENLESVELPEGLTGIGMYAFIECYSLSEINIPGTVTEIGSCAFASCFSLNEITLPEGLTGIEEGTFFDTPLTKIDIPENVKYIDCAAFQYCFGITELTLPEGLEFIGAHAFCHISAEKVEIPASVQEIDYGAFISGDSLIAIEVAEGNPNYRSIDGVLFTSDGTKLVEYPSGKTDESYTVPASVKQIEIQAFLNAPLKEIILPEGLESIYRYAFASCEDLHMADIPASVTEIEEFAFGYDEFLDGDHYNKLYEGFTIRGYAGSAAEAYAKKNGMWFIDAETGVKTQLLPFDDISSGKYYTTAVIWALNNTVATGISKTAFGPDEDCTRAQAVTFLWRQYGCPEPETTENPFVDVKEGSYYYKAVLWAYEKGITAGTGKTHFSPDKACTRAQIVTFLWRFVEEPEPEIDNPFADVAAEQYYKDAVCWAYDWGITFGKTETAFAPDETCTRAQIVTFLWRIYSW